MTGDALSLDGVRFRWPGPEGFTLACRDLRLKQGERVLLTGASGSGKSTLLSLIGGIVAPEAGTIRVAGTDLGRLRAGGRDRFRAEQIGLLFQQFNLLPYASVLDNIQLPLHFAPERRRRAGSGPAEAKRLTQALGIGDLLRRRAGSLSMGQQQRVALARALIGTPPLILADEPTSALDPVAQDVFLSLLFAQLETSGATLLLVSHDERIAPRFDRVVALSDILQTGATA